ncbi:MAG: LysM peptidoglycan-binding domain-containing protein [Nitrospira sp.]|nr:LysM peptidoglycan-binding domain-containing protein [Nitrospira sp.]MCP9441485.1 LysM peptidoglycan-binding domain-containing protein [Nitrospira sp.]
MEKAVATVNRKAGKAQKAGKALRHSLTGLLAVCGLLLGGCVVLEEKYEAEKARSLNFQRLLAQEERRASELESEVKRTKRELMEFEARNRELLAQIQAIREQMTRLQEEAESVKEAALLERKAMEEMRKLGGQAATKAKKVEPQADMPRAEDRAQKNPPKATKSVEVSPHPPVAAKPGTIIHIVKPGETLFRISRRYGVEAEKLKELNKLTDDIIEVGQQLVIAIE